MSKSRLSKVLQCTVRGKHGLATSCSYSPVTTCLTLYSNIYFPELHLFSFVTFWGLIGLSHFPLGTTSQLDYITERSKVESVQGAELVARMAQAEKTISNPNSHWPHHKYAQVSVLLCWLSHLNKTQRISLDKHCSSWSLTPFAHHTHSTAGTPCARNTGSAAVDSWIPFEALTTAPKLENIKAYLNIQKKATWPSYASVLSTHMPEGAACDRTLNTEHSDTALSLPCTAQAVRPYQHPRDPERGTLAILSVACCHWVHFTQTSCTGFTQPILEYQS